jgi:hypothetical protein
MGMFNSIHADVTCPVTGDLLPGSEIQIKWQEHDHLWLGVYKVDDSLEGLEPRFDNTWIKPEFICDACSRHETGWEGKPYIPTAGQVWHAVYVEIREGRIRQVLNAQQFAETGVTAFATYR